MNRLNQGLVALAIVGLLASAADAQAPQFLPLRGVLEDSAGVAIDGSATVTFALYASAASASPLFTETQTVQVEEGQLLANIGAAATLDLTIFRDNPEVWLGIKVNADPEMSPRIELGSVPYAAYAEYCGEAETVGGQAPSELAMPSGAVMFFDLPSCPTGWTELTAARGRAIVGLPSGGTGLGTVGTALTDLEDRAHSHSVDPAAVDSASAGAHTHAVDPPSTTSASGGAHNHAWLNFSAVGTPGSPGPLTTYTTSGTTTSSLFSRLAVSAGSGEQAISPGGGIAYTDNEAAHTHSVDVAAFDSGPTPGHAHSVDVGATDSTAATTGQVMPYVQLLVCRKD